MEPRDENEYGVRAPARQCLGMKKKVEKAGERMIIRRVFSSMNVCKNFCLSGLVSRDALAAAAKEPREILKKKR